MTVTQVNVGRRVKERRLCRQHKKTASVAGSPMNDITASQDFDAISLRNQELHRLLKALDHKGSLERQVTRTSAETAH